MLNRRTLLASAASLVAGAIVLGKTGIALAETFDITTVVKITGINWFNRMEVGVQKFGSENPGVVVSQIGPPSADAALQVQMIEGLIAKKVNAIAVVPTSP